MRGRNSAMAKTAKKKARLKGKSAPKRTTQSASKSAAKSKSKAASKAPLYLTEADVQRLATVKDAIATLELMFETWPDATTSNLPRQRAQIGQGSFNLMGAAWGASDIYGLKAYYGAP